VALSGVDDDAEQLAALHELQGLGA